MPESAPDVIDEIPAGDTRIRHILEMLWREGTLDERVLQSKLRETHKLLLPLPKLFGLLVELRKQGLVESAVDAEHYPPKDEADWNLSASGITWVESTQKSVKAPTPIELFRSSTRLGVLLYILENPGSAQTMRERLVKKGTDLSGGQLLASLLVLKHLGFARELFPPEIEQIGAEGWTLTPEGRRFLDTLPNV